jgi:hypothetical protein
VKLLVCGPIIISRSFVLNGNAKIICCIDTLADTMDVKKILILRYNTQWHGVWRENIDEV